MSYRPLPVRTALLLLPFALLACAEGTAPRTQLVSISLATPATAATAAVVAAAPIVGGGHSLDLAAASLTVGDLRLEHAGHQGEDDHGVGSDDVLFAAGPLTIALPVGGGVVTLSSQALPAGTFSEVEADLRSLRVIGRYDTVPFDVAIELSHDLELALTPPLVTRGGAEQNVTIAIDLSRCFAPGGVPLDPRALADGGSDARRAFRSCVAGRLSAFEDDDHDGHGEHETEHEAGDR